MEGDEQFRMFCIDAVLPPLPTVVDGELVVLIADKLPVLPF